MKKFAERFPGQKPSNGFVAPCRHCGELVVHGTKSLEPYHMHRRSKVCQERALVQGKSKDRLVAHAALDERESRSTSSRRGGA